MIFIQDLKNINQARLKKAPTGASRLRNSLANNVTKTNKDSFSIYGPTIPGAVRLFVTNGKVTGVSTNSFHFVDAFEVVEI